MDTLHRFLAKTSSVKTMGCWEWIGGKYSNGYGGFRFNSKFQRAHRVAYQLFIGPISDGLCVLHHCDNPGCVRPDHLYMGTHQDNMNDKKERGKVAKGGRPGARGEHNALSKLTEAQVREIRLEYQEGTISQRKLGVKFGVARSTIRDIVRQRNWKYVT